MCIYVYVLVYKQNITIMNMLDIVIVGTSKYRE